MLGAAGPNSDCGYGAATAKTPRCPADGGLGGGRMNLSTTEVDMEAVHAELMTEQGNRSVAFGRHKMCLENMLFSLCSLLCHRVTDGVGLKRGRWLCDQPIPSSRKEMGLQGSPPLGVPGSTGMPVQTRSQFTLDLLSPFPGLILQLPKLSSFFTKKLLLQHVKEEHRLPACPSSLHPLSQLLPTSSTETASVLISPLILRKLLCHVSALRHRHITNRGLHPAGLEIHFGYLLWYLADVAGLEMRSIPCGQGMPLHLCRLVLPIRRCHGENRAVLRWLSETQVKVGQCSLPPHGSAAMSHWRKAAILCAEEGN